MASTLILDTPRGRTAALAARLRAAARRLHAAWRSWRARAEHRRELAATMAMLRGLDDATLRDLAIDRSEISAAAIAASMQLQRGNWR